MRLPRRHQHPANIAVHDSASRSDRAVDKFVSYFGSLRFIMWQTVIIIIWIIVNLIAFIRHWDPYPFILLNLVFSTQAAYAAPLILMAQNRQTEHDRIHAEHSYEVGARTETLLCEMYTRLCGPLPGRMRGHD